MAEPEALAYSTAAFRREREGDWTAFEALVDRLERGSLRRLSDDELLALPRYYRATLSSLSIARATSLDVALIDYLESLSVRGYFLIYGVRETRLARLGHFFRTGWPSAVRALWKETLLIAALVALAAVVSFNLVTNDPSWYAALIPDMFNDGRGPDASTAALRETIYGVPEEGGFHIFATFLFTHNSQVSITSYALGFAFGVPTLLLEFYQGIPLGAMFAVFYKAGLGPDFAAWLSIHGTTELFAGIISGACGLRIGTGFAFPGPHSRMSAAAEAGKSSGAAMLGVLIMLLLAGLLEGFARQLVQPMALRFAVGGSMLVFWLVYFYMPRHNVRAGGGAR
ncbi:MAG: stage II sporulation protein M [Sphingopyxis sp.]